MNVGWLWSSHPNFGPASLLGHNKVERACLIRVLILHGPAIGLCGTGPGPRVGHSGDCGSHNQAEEPLTKSQWHVGNICFLSGPSTRAVCVTILATGHNPRWSPLCGNPRVLISEEEQCGPLTPQLRRGEGS